MKDHCGLKLKEEAKPWIEKPHASNPEAWATRKFRGRRTRQMMERSGSFAHIEEAAVVFEVLRKFWRIAT